MESPKPGDVAFAGGIDLCHNRRDRGEHCGDPQAVAMAAAYDEHPPWHDLQLAVSGPVVGALRVFARDLRLRLWPEHLDRAPGGRCRRTE